MLIPYLGYLIGYALIVFDLIDQYLIWGTFIIITITFVIAQLIRLRPKTSESQKEVSPQGRVHTWNRQVSNWDEGIYFKWQFSQKFAPLLLDVLSSYRGLSTNQGYQLLETDRLDAPAIVIEYLNAAYNKRILDYFSTQKAILEKSMGLNYEPHQILDEMEGMIYGHHGGKYGNN